MLLQPGKSAGMERDAEARGRAGTSEKENKKLDKSEMYAKVLGAEG